MYVGAVPTTGDFKKLDSITTSSSTTFNLRQGGVAVYPQSANHCIVSLNGVIQAPVDAFTIVNDTIVFASSLASSDVINFILVLGNVNDIGTVSDDTVSTAKLQANSVTAAKFNADVISGQTELATTPADTVEFLISDAGVLKRIDYSHLKSTAGLVQTGRSIISSDTAGIYLDDIFSTTYTNYIILIRNMTPASDEDDFRFRVNVSGTQKSTSEYIYMTEFLDTGGGSQGHESSASDTEIKLAHDVDNESWKGGYNAIMHVSTHLSDASNRAAFVMSGTASYVGDSGVGYVSHFGGTYADSDRAAVTGLDFYYNSGDIARGEITCYGVTIS